MHSPYLSKIVESTDSFFESQDVENIASRTLAEYCAETLGQSVMAETLEDLLSNEENLEEVRVASYMVSPVFTKLMLHRASSGWGMRVHLFEPPAGQAIQEPWHEHRWHLGSTVLAGELRSHNAVARLVHDSATSNEARYLYRVPDKRVLGAIRPEYMGRCELEQQFEYTVPRGFSYAQRLELAHALSIKQPTVTTVLTAPPTRRFATFIEPHPLHYRERPMPEPLTTDALIGAIRRALAHMSAAEYTTADQNLEPALLPDLLYATGNPALV